MDQNTEVLNEVTVEGVVVSDAISLNQTKAGTYISNFMIETREAGRASTPVQVGVKVFGKLANECYATLRRGERIVIKGELATSPHQKVEIKARAIAFNVAEDSNLPGCTAAA